ncbi:permease [Actinoallomurus rhizosphaericola]|uniref:permease n=1 Tax=Actinoallomurus rhizosphaericola TaxID=2952536 RepID=UPI0020935954|nr:permease [Actinoallomurus rhizosphaericola]MCO5997511.1 permease [Actinoallomurus rhizosphaericola]
MPTPASSPEAPPADDAAASGRRPRAAGLPLVTALIVAAVALRPVLTGLFGHPAVANWATVFVAITIQALPFLVLGVAVSASIAAFVPPGLIARLLPKRPALAVPAAAAAGAALPGCECGSVPVAARLVSIGVTPAAAFAFLLSAPAINPVVLVSTAVAFPGRPAMVLARFLASLSASVVMGLLWIVLGRDDLIKPRRSDHTEEGPRLAVFLATAQHDLLQAGGFLVIGAGTAATLQTLVPRSIVDSVAGTGPLSLLVLGVLAVVVALCSEADAFVAAGLKQFSLTARLAFLVVGPMVDVKLFALQAGTFGTRFAWRFSLATFAVAVACAGLVGWWLL